MKATSLSRTDATEKMLQRQEWKLEQERQRQHERLKQEKIYAYETQRAREKGCLPPKPPNRSKSRSKSPRSRPRRPCTSSSTNTPILSGRLESADGTVPLFKRPEGTKISAAELRRIKIDIHRNIPGKSTDSDLQRDIINPEDVVVKRRAGEGSKPIFEREEIKGAVTITDEVEEHRTVVTVNNDTSEGKSKTFKKRSMSLSPIRNRSLSPRRTLSRHSRHEDSKHEDRRSYRDDRERYRSRNGSREYKNGYRDKERRRTESHIDVEDRDRRSRDHSRSREREERKWDRDIRHRDERSHRDGDREQRVPSPHYIPVPIYCSFPPRPNMMAPFMTYGSHPPMMGPIRPFLPRFSPSNPKMKPNSSSRNDVTEKMLRRQEWKREQERQRQHERLKQKKIYEYEMQRAREKGLQPPKPPNRSKSRSKSPRSRPRRPCTSSSTNIPILSGRLESADGTVPLFKRPEGTKISAAELRRIKIDIHRNIPGKSTDSDLQRDIINPEDVVVKRRAGEGSKPIFEREEIKGAVTKTEEVEEHRTVVTVNNDTLEDKSKTFKNHSTSLSPIRNRSHSPRRTLSRHSSASQGYGKQKTWDMNTNKLYVPDCTHMLAYANHHRDERSHRDQREYRQRSRERFRERSREHFRDRRDRDRSREQTVSSQHHIGHLPFPIYYSFPPRPIMMAPFMPHGRHPPMMGPLRPFPPRFSPSNPRCGPMF